MFNLRNSEQRRARIILCRSSGFYDPPFIGEFGRIGLDWIGLDRMWDAGANKTAFLSGGIQAMV